MSLKIKGVLSVLMLAWSMETPAVVLKYIAIAVLNSLAPGSGELVVEVVLAVAKDVWQVWHGNRSRAEMQGDIEAIANASPQETKTLAAAVVREVAGSQSVEVQATLMQYLNQVPGAMRRSLCRPEDPRGRTIPLALVPRSAEDVLRMLPHKLSRFKVGDRPPGIGNWQLVELLGVGGFGEVWKACNPDFPTDIVAALKFCYNLDEMQREALDNEAKLAVKLRQRPGIVELRQIDLRSQTPYLQYEYVAGGELTGLIRQWHSGQGGPNPVEAARVIRRLAEIAGIAHGMEPPIVHRDLKPANILIEAGNGEAQFKITDFGIGGTAAAQAIRQTRQGLSPGMLQVSCLQGAYTPLYASPQQMNGFPADPRDDVYALGVIWYQLLTGNLQSGAPSGQRWVQRLRERGMADGLIEVLAGCCEPERGDRPENGAVLAERLTRLLSESAPKPLPKPTPTWPTFRFEVVTVDETGQEVKREPGTAQFFTETLGKRFWGKSIVLEMVLIPGGTFLMGSPETEAERYDCEGPQHRVTVPAFCMGKYPVTQAQWKAVVALPKVHRDLNSDPAHFKGADLPVEQVSWEEANEFCARLSQKTGRPYRLPSEAEWEYACRAGTTTPFYFGETLTPDLANYRGSDTYAKGPKGKYREQTTDVGTFPPNGFGLYDLHGNVWEWCQDLWHDSYNGAPTDGSAWINKDVESSERVLRGGSWFNDPANCRSAIRIRDVPGAQFNDLGFRVVCAVPRLL